MRPLTFVVKSSTKFSPDGTDNSIFKRTALFVFHLPSVFKTNKKCRSMFVFFFKISLINMLKKRWTALTNYTGKLIKHQLFSVFFVHSNRFYLLVPFSIRFNKLAELQVCLKQLARVLIFCHPLFLQLP